MVILYSAIDIKSGDKILQEEDVSRLSDFILREITVLDQVLYLANRSPHSTLEGATPYSKMHNLEPDLTGLRAIGARAFVHRETYTKKLEDRAFEVAPVAQRYHVTSDTLGREFDPGKRDFSH